MNELAQTLVDLVDHGFEVIFRREANCFSILLGRDERCVERVVTFAEIRLAKFDAIQLQLDAMKVLLEEYVRETRKQK